MPNDTAPAWPDPAHIAKDRADWLVDAIATATQDRRYLRGEPEADNVAIEAILLNGEKAIRVALNRFAALATAREAAAWAAGAAAMREMAASYCHGRTTSRSFGSWADAFEAAEGGVRALPLPPMPTQGGNADE